MKSTPFHVTRVLLVVSGLAGIGCSGIVDPEAPPPGEGSNSIASSGGTGTTAGGVAIPPTSPSGATRGGFGPGGASCSPVDAGCVQNVLCIRGDHWDRTQCRCVPDACISQGGGPCGGFIVNPCLCAPGLMCVSRGIPDVGGTCLAPPSEVDASPPPNLDLPGPSSGACAVAADCGKGQALPALCVQCGDGGFGCAHWTCVAQGCQMTFCE